MQATTVLSNVKKWIGRPNIRLIPYFKKRGRWIFNRVASITP